MKKRLVIISILVISLLLVSCYSVKTIHDDFDNYTIHRMQGNCLAVKNQELAALDELNLQKTILDEGIIIPVSVHQITLTILGNFIKNM